MTMAYSDEYRSKLRTPKKELKQEQMPWETNNMSFDQLGFANFPHLMSTPSPLKREAGTSDDLSRFESPHKSGYFLRTPSPPHKVSSNFLGSPKMCKPELPGTPSPHRAGSATDLFGNRSLLDNLPVPDWDENFLDNFQEDLLFGLGNEDIEVLMKSPAKSPGRAQRFLSPLKGSAGLSPLKGPLLTSSPKGMMESSPGGLNKTPAVCGRPLTRQRRLFLQSPERQGPPQHYQPSNASASGWSSTATTSSFSPVDTSTSSLFSNESQETSVSIQNISTYLKRFDEEDHEEELPVMPPAGWVNKGAPTLKPSSHSKGKHLAKHKSHSAHPLKGGHRTSASLFPASASSIGSKKARVEPQFTLLKPQTEILNNQICLRMTPRTPPNKIKISRDFSQIQTLPSKEQLRIVRNRFRETLNKAVEQVIEKEKETRKVKGQNMNDPELRNALQRVPIEPQVLVQATTIAAPIQVYGAADVPRKQQGKKRKR
ncbi:uncharacterized protein LOC106011941 [Aplysia californica]|uniref:Uncharacterized protein LOC106011941 n=1 Tax=Aplysia californica TaxID=6500 RepID=A0ABM1A151_APLCA|nr:uncharacterized protein LOC106011941 [Aplysia californica]